MKRRTSTDSQKKLTESQLEQIRALKGQPNIQDIPEISSENWKKARQLFKARKEPISIRLDADVLVWLRNRGPGYQSEINRFLRDRMEAEGAKAAVERSEA